jgi:antiviral helicase SLH1
VRVWDFIPRIKVEETQTSSNTLRVHVRRLNRGYTDRNLIYAPKFSKPQQESWFVIASDPSGERLLGLQRVSLSGRGGGDGTVELQLATDYTGDSLIIKVVSDGWRGVDVEKVVAWKLSANVIDT